MKVALQTLKWPQLKGLLDALGGPTADPATLVEALRRADRLVFEYPAPAQEAKRQAMLDDLHAYFTTGRPEGVPPGVQEVLETLRVAEAGYRKLLGTLSSTAAYKLPPGEHIAAAIALAEREALSLNALLLEQAEDQAKKQGYVSLAFRIDNDSGPPLDPNAGMEHIINFVAQTILMEAHKGKLFGEGDEVIIPVSPTPSERTQADVFATYLLATLWRRWRSVEQAARLMGGSLRFLQADEPRPQGSEGAEKVIEVQKRDQADWLHWAALERLLDRFGQNLMEMMGDPVVRRQLAEREGRKDLLPPNGLLSVEEYHAHWSMSEALAYDVRVDQERPGGLRLIEWVRGYCALKELAKTTKQSALIRTRSGWLYFFAEYGLTAAIAEQFIKHLTFRKSSRDLFDHPFIKRDDGKYMLFRTAFETMLIPSVVFSALSSIGERFQGKGSSFEVKVRELFKAANIPTFSFKATRGNQEFQYDLVVAWGDYLFVIECKNRFLPHGSPTLMHFFDLENQENVRQVKRLSQALDDHPDIAAEHLPPGALDLKRVEVVLNCLPYSVPGGIDGVRFYDYSALSRFFKNGQIRAGGLADGKAMPEVAMGPRIWAGASPTAEDLLAQMDGPLQVRRMLDLTEFHPHLLPLPPDWNVLIPDFSRHPDPAEGAAHAALSDQPSQYGTSDAPAAGSL